SETVLERILASTRAEVAQRRRAVPLAQLRERAAALDAGVGAVPDRERRLRGALTGPGISVIAEFKRRSPSAGQLREGADLRAVVGAYERGGARAVSVLTEGPHFAGSLADLQTARAACDLPLLRKDFIVDPYQLHEACAAGADAVLLIVAALAQDELDALHAAALELGLDALVEVHDREELRRALAAGAELVGVNNRDLRDFSVDVRRTFELLDAVPAGVAVVSESGIATAAQMRELHGAGVQAVLIGETLMRAGDPEAALRELLQTGAAPGPAGAPTAGSVASSGI
ncbi:MAG TPA: indole-3-glycerol phosphate synthase TrpC, partial [Solirubrobacteraceae bacterium]|nr:indole-3-glycerol phosphate synthase TrpC [Solirubrobacteraceae bacterium]